MDNQLRQIIEEAWNDRALLAESRVREAVRAVIEELDKGRLRTAEPIDPSRSQWQVNEWVKKAILLYFPMQEMRTMRAGELEWHDKIGKQSLILTNEPKGGQAQSILAALYPQKANNKELTTHCSISSSI